MYTYQSSSLNMSLNQSFICITSFNNPSEPNNGSLVEKLNREIEFNVTKSSILF